MICEEKRLLNQKVGRSNSNSGKSKKFDGSNNYVFSIKNNSFLSCKHCSKFDNFMDNFTQIKNPCYSTDLDFFKK